MNNVRQIFHPRIYSFCQMGPSSWPVLPQCPNRYVHLYWQASRLRPNCCLLVSDFRILQNWSTCLSFASQSALLCYPLRSSERRRFWIDNRVRQHDMLQLFCRILGCWISCSKRFGCLLCWRCSEGRCIRNELGELWWLKISWRSSCRLQRRTHSDRLDSGSYRGGIRGSGVCRGGKSYRIWAGKSDLLFKKLL